MLGKTDCFCSVSFLRAVVFALQMNFSRKNSMNALVQPTVTAFIKRRKKIFKFLLATGYKINYIKWKKGNLK